MSGPLVLGVLVLVIGFGSSLVKAPQAQPPEGSGATLYALAAVLPAAGLAMLAGRLFSAEVAIAGGTGELVKLAALATALLSMGILAAWVLLAAAPAPPVMDEVGRSLARTRLDRLRKHPVLAVPMLTFALLPICLAVAGLRWPELVPGVGRRLSAIGVLLVGLAAFAAAGGTARLLMADWDRPSLVGHLGMPRTPVVALLLIWFLGATAVTARYEKPDRSPHVVRTLPRAAATAPGCGKESPVLAALRAPPEHELVAQQLCRWLDANAKVTPVGSGGAVPLVLVAASGGGVRAAVWTARVLDCLFLAAPADGTDPCGSGRVGTGGDDPYRYLFAAGGASGGSVGIVSALAEHLGPIPGRSDWVKQLRRDHVGPLLGQAVIGELPLAPFGVAPGLDRAEVLIDGWSNQFTPVRGAVCPPLAGRHFRDVGFLELEGACAAWTPLMLLNGTVVRTGQRFNISPLDGSATPADAASSWTAGSIDLLDVLCPNQDLALFDAAFLSARFPFATPSGRFLKPEKGCARDIASGVDVVDGGYLENSGAGQVGELYDVLAPLIANYQAANLAGYRQVKVVVVQIENGERSGVVQGPPKLASPLAEPLRVPEAKLAIMGGSGESKAALGGLLAAARRNDATVVEFALYAHPGRRLPLGWALTDQIFDDIGRVYGLDLNRTAAEQFRSATAHPAR